MSLCNTKFVSPGVWLPLHGESAAVLGMSQEVRDAFGRLLTRLERGPVTLAGELAPDRMLLDRARRQGALEAAEDLPCQGCVALPLTGLPQAEEQRFREAGCEILDLTLPSIRRTRATIRMLKLESRQVVLVGDPDSAEVRTLAAEGAVVVQDVDRAMQLPFSPRFGLVCQSHVGSERWATVASALRRRHPDSSLVMLDTRDPGFVIRERAVTRLARCSEGVAILADERDPSGRALFEAVRLCGTEALRTADVPEALAFARQGRRALASGLFVADEVLTISP